MKITPHATERILDRTKMRIEDVLSIVSNGAGVELGKTEGYRYLLFYSPPDNVSKIAVVSDCGSHLISIWDRNFALPDGIGKVTREHERRARIVMKNFIFERLAPHNKKRFFTAKIQILEGQSVVFEADGGEIPTREIYTLESAFKYLAPRLAPIAQVVEEYKECAERKIKYRILLIDPETAERVRRHELGHKKIHEYL